MEWGRRRHRTGRSGFTLVEITVVLGLAGVLLAAGIPRFRDVQERIAVRAAREDVVGLLSRARYHAVLRGGAEVRVSEALDALALSSSGALVESRDLVARYGVELRVVGSGSEIVLRFGPMGLGRFTSRTLELHRGDAVARLTLSSYGRVRRG